MQPGHHWLGVAAGLLTAGLISGSVCGDAQAQAALTGVVSSSDEGPMEGVLVSAKKDGSSITTTVVSDQQGAYSFPSARLEPGKYTISIRAIGYRLDGPKTVDVAAAGEGRADLKLSKVKSLVPQLSSGEWLLSLPGADKQSLSDDVPVLPHAPARPDLQPRCRRIPAGVPAHVALFAGHYADPSAAAASRSARRAAGRHRRRRQAAAEFLANLTLGNSEATEYAFKPLPRPKGRATKVMVTDRPAAQRGDATRRHRRDAGQVRYSDFGTQFVGFLDPKTGTTKDIPIPVLLRSSRRAASTSSSTRRQYLAGDDVPSRHHEIDRKTQGPALPFPKDWLSTSAQASMVSPLHSNVDGKVWTNNQDTATTTGSISTGKCENRVRSSARRQADPRLRHAHRPGEQPLSAGIRRPRIGRRDAKTLESRSADRSRCRARAAAGSTSRTACGSPTMAATPSACSTPDRAIKEWKLPTPGARPTTWSPSRTARGLDRLDAERPGIPAQYQDRRGRGISLAAQTNIRRVFVDETGARPVLWVGSNHGASIVKVEPLD